MGKLIVCVPKNHWWSFGSQIEITGKLEICPFAEQQRLKPEDGEALSASDLAPESGIDHRSIYWMSHSVASGPFMSST